MGYDGSIYPVLSAEQVLARNAGGGADVVIPVFDDWSDNPPPMKVGELIAMLQGQPYEAVVKIERRDYDDDTGVGRVLLLTEDADTLSDINFDSGSDEVMIPTVR